MATVKSVGLAEKVGGVVLSDKSVAARFIAAGLSFLGCMLMAFSLENHSQSRDMSAGFMVLSLLGGARFAAIHFTSHRNDWLLSGIFRFAAAGALYIVEGAVLDHGFRGVLWLVIIAYQCVVAVFSFLAVYGVTHGFHTFDPQSRKQARFEEALMSDLQKSL